MPASMKRRGPAALVRREFGGAGGREEGRGTGERGGGGLGREAAKSERRRDKAAPRLSDQKLLLPLPHLPPPLYTRGSFRRSRTDSLHGGAGMEERFPCPPLQGGG